MKQATQRAIVLKSSIPAHHPCHRKRPLPSLIVYAVAVLAAIAATYTPAILTDVAIAQEPPSLSTSFNPSSIAVGDTTGLNFTITNPAANVVALTGVSFADTLPVGLTIGDASVGICGGTVTLVAASRQITLTNVNLGVDGSCNFTVTVTGAASGTYSVTTNVTSTNGGAALPQTATLVVGAPTVTGVSPPSGPTAGGTPVVITGANFTGATAVKFGGANASVYTVDSDAQITATSPASAAGTVHITVTTPAGASATSVADQFTYLATTVTIPAATRRGDIILTTDTPGCWFSNVQVYTEEQVGGDSVYDYPFGLVGFTLNCAGPADVSLTYTGAADLSGRTYRKHGPTTPGDPSTTKWYTYTDVTIAGNRVTLQNLRDGQFGDDTGVDGVIVDQGGPGQLPAPVPTMTEWGIILLIALLGMRSVYYLRKRKRAI